MPLPVPDHDTLAAIAAGYGLGLSAAAVEEFAPAVSGLLGSWDAVEELYAADAPVAPDRAWSRPDAADNPYNAWYVTTSITETTEGPLAGRTVAVKDNTAVAGVPMTNGSATVEGYVPTTDATIVSRLLAAGATIAGKAVCEDLCFAGASITSNTGDVGNPWAPERSAGGFLRRQRRAGRRRRGRHGHRRRPGRVDPYPGAYSGLVGHKPTWGLVPYTGAFPIEFTIDHVGPITRTVGDAALMLSVVAGVDGLDPRQPTTIDAPTTSRPCPRARGAAGRRRARGLRARGVRARGRRRRAGRDQRARRRRHDAPRCRCPGTCTASKIWDVIATEGATFQMIETYGYGMNWKGLYDPEMMDHYGARWIEDGTHFSETVKLVLLAGKSG